MVYDEKDLVPCEVGALARYVFEITGAGMPYQADDSIFRGHLLIHTPPSKAGMRTYEKSCIVDATGCCPRIVEEKFDNTGSYRFENSSREPCSSSD
jgi:hypothetical protein